MVPAINPLGNIKYIPNNIRINACKMPRVMLADDINQYLFCRFATANRICDTDVNSRKTNRLYFPGNTSKKLNPNAFPTKNKTITIMIINKETMNDKPQTQGYSSS